MKYYGTSRRGHTWRDVVRAVSRMKGKGMTVGLQFMLGLPGQNAQSPSFIVKAIKGNKTSFYSSLPRSSDRNTGNWQSPTE